MANIPAAAEQIKESLKETLLGTEEPATVSSESKDRFLKYATIEDNGEMFMTQEDFVNAIAPPEEDYVRTACNASQTKKIALLTPVAAQNRKSSVWSSFQRRRCQKTRQTQHDRFQRIREPHQQTRC